MVKRAKDASVGNCALSGAVMEGCAVTQASKRDHATRAWSAFRDHLETIRAETGSELLAYPQPATECDLHYRDLLERRCQVNEDLAKLMTNPPGDDDAADWDDWLSWFEGLIRSSPFGEEAREFLKAKA
jgi:hypothetical protein